MQTPKIISQIYEQDLIKDQRIFLDNLFKENEIDPKTDINQILRIFFTLKDFVDFMKILDENQENKLIISEQIKRPDFLSKIAFYFDNSNNTVFDDKNTKNSAFYERFLVLPISTVRKFLKYELIKFIAFKKSNNTKDFPILFLQNLKNISRNFSHLKAEQNSQQNLPDLTSDSKSIENNKQNTNENIGQRILNKVNIGPRISRLFTSNKSSKSNDDEKEKSNKLNEVDSLNYFSMKSQIHIFYFFLLHSLSSQKKILSIYGFLHKLPLPDTLRCDFWKKILEVEFDPFYLFSMISIDNNIFPNKTKLFSQIENDIPRCHQYHPYFNSYEGKLKLYDLLVSVMNLDKNITYIQGIDAMGAVVLEATQFKVDLACVFLGKIIDKTIRNFIHPNDEKNYVKEYLLMFQWLLFFVEPLLANHLMEIGFLPELYAVSWILNLFSSKHFFLIKSFNYDCILYIFIHP